MKMKFLSLIIFLKCCLAVERTKKIYLNTLSSQPRMQFISKFGVNIGEGEIQIDFYKFDNTDLFQNELYYNLRLGLLMDEQYEEFINQDTCDDRELLFKDSFQLEFADQERGQKRFKINQSVRQHLWYIYVYDCSFDTLATNTKLVIQTKMLNNGSHLSSHEDMFFFYGLFLGLWIIGTIFLLNMIFEAFSEDEYHWPKILIYSSFIFTGISYLLKMTLLTLFLYFAIEFKYFQAIYLAFKNISEGIIVTVFIAVAWGWTIIHLRNQTTYIFLGVIGTLINLGSLFLQSSMEQSDLIHHQYGGMIGLVLIGLRMVNWLIFAFGIFRSLTNSATKTKKFLKKLYLFGSIYLLGWPTALLISELFLPLYYHLKAILVVGEICHLLACFMICWMYGKQNSEYKRLIKKEDPSQSKKTEQTGKRGKKEKVKMVETEEDVEIAEHIEITEQIKIQEKAETTGKKQQPETTESGEVAEQEEKLKATDKVKENQETKEQEEKVENKQKAEQIQS